MIGNQDEDELVEEIGEHQVDIADQQAEMEERVSEESKRGRGRP